MECTSPDSPGETAGLAGLTLLGLDETTKDEPVTMSISAVTAVANAGAAAGEQPGPLGFGQTRHGPSEPMLPGEKDALQKAQPATPG